MSRHTFGPPRLLLCVVATTCLGACSGGLERVSSPCPDGQELREERYDATSIKARGCVGRNSENNYSGEGRWEFFYPSGQKKAEGSYADTLHTVVDGFHSEEDDSAGIMIDGREGPWALWYDNGQKWQEMTYRDGNKEGLYATWHENGQKKQETTYRDGQEEGLHTEWHDNGQKSVETTYRDGTRTSGTEWDENGNQINAD